GKNNKESNLLSWKTSSEIKSNYYEVQRSKDGKNFKKIGNVYAQGTTSSENSYSFNDNMPLAGTNFYRLSIVDLDGKMSYSKTVTVSVKVAHSLTISYASLSLDTKSLKLSLNSDHSQSVRAAITDASGRVFFNTSLALQAGTNSFTKNIPKFSKGIYFIKFSAGDDLITKSLLSE
ncbi:MAG: T9SS type A sorting domain-containing protein, partial [Ginsengibacter sp.]